MLDLPESQAAPLTSDKRRKRRLCENVEKPAAEKSDERGEVKFFALKSQRNRTDGDDCRHKKRMRKCAVWEMSFDQARKRKENFSVN